MALAENAVNEICLPNNTENNIALFTKGTSSSNKERKIGFMFFNTDVYLEKGKRILKVSDKAYENDRSQGDNFKVDFSNFNELYELGKNQAEGYGTNFS